MRPHKFAAMIGERRRIVVYTMQCGHIHIVGDPDDPEIYAAAQMHRQITMELRGLYDDQNTD
jgi:hypothetical protein